MFLRSMISTGCFALIFGTSGLASADAVRYTNGNWFNGVSFSQKDVVVRNGKIVTEDHSATVFDLRGAYVIPGLAEAHNHNLQNCYLAPQMAQAYLKRGILYSAQLFASDPAGLQCAMLFEGTSAPSTAFARIGVTSSTGHPIGIARAGAKEAGLDMSFDELTEGMLIADNVADLQRKWKQFRATKTDFVKVVLIDEVNGAANTKRPELNGFNGVQRDVLLALMPLARTAGLRVLAHVDTAADFRLAAEAGVDTIAHLPGYRLSKGSNIDQYRLSEEAAKTAANNGVAVIPTMAASSYYLAAHPSNAAAVAELYAHNLRLLKKYQVKLLTGSDRFEGSVLDEISTLSRTGLFQPAELIHMSASTTAQWMFPKRRIGCLEQGCEASFSVYESDPLKDLANLSKPYLVFKHGTAVANNSRVTEKR